MDGLKRVRASAKGVSYQGIGTRWHTAYGQMIFITENPDILRQFCLDVMGDEVDGSKFSEVAVFSQKDTQEKK